MKTRKAELTAGLFMGMVLIGTVVVSVILSLPNVVKSEEIVVENIIRIPSTTERKAKTILITEQKTYAVYTDDIFKRVVVMKTYESDRKCIVATTGVCHNVLMKKVVNDE